MAHTPKRTQQYRAFRKEVKIITRKFKHAATNPFGIAIVTNYRRYGAKFEALPEKWQARIQLKVERAIAQYHKPILLGNDGQWYSAADIDHAMARGAY